MTERLLRQLDEKSDPTVGLGDSSPRMIKGRFSRPVRRVVVVVVVDVNEWQYAGSPDRSQNQLA